jgi:hypothetical protein
MNTEMGDKGSANEAMWGCGSHCRESTVALKFPKKL